MKAYIQRTVDYTLKRKGDAMFAIVDADAKVLDKSGGYWKTKKAALAQLARMGLEFAGTLPTVHQHYSHWADFTPVK